MYTKTNWVARVGTALNRFLKTNETSTEVELTNDPTGVTTAGTPFTVANMNKIEQGIYDAHYPEFTEAATLTNIASGEVGTTLWGKVKKAIAYLIANVNQGVKTTDSPTFYGIGVSNFYPPEYIIYDGSKSNTDFKVINSQAGSYSIGSITGDNAIITTSTYVKKREIESKATGTVRVSHLVRAGSNRTAYTRVYVNGVAIGIEHQLVTSASAESQTFTDDIVVEYGDLVQIYGKVSVPDDANTYVGATYIMSNIRPSLQ